MVDTATTKAVPAAAGPRYPARVTGAACCAAYCATPAGWWWAW